MAKFDMQKWQNTRKTAENWDKKGAKKSAQAGVSKTQNLLPTSKDRYTPTQNLPAASRNGKDIPQVAPERCNQAIPAAKNSIATPPNQDALYI